MSRRHGFATAFALATLLGLPQAGGARANDGSSPSLLALLPLLETADAVAQIDRLDASDVTKLQRRLLLFEGALAVGYLPCTGEIRSDASPGITFGCLQFGVLGRLQPV